MKNFRPIDHQLDDMLYKSVLFWMVQLNYSRGVLHLSYVIRHLFQKPQNHTYQLIHSVREKVENWHENGL